MTSRSRIIDAHCHAWRRWPYDTSVPDPNTRGSIEALLYEMDTHGVDHATVVCARIGGGAGAPGFANPDNNDYVTEAARRHPDQITAWIDVDCVWTASYHRPGAADRLRAELNRTGSRGFTHYFARENDGWLRTDEAAAFFEAVDELGAIASLAVGAAWFEDLGRVIGRHPSVPVLLHHLGQAPRSPGSHEPHLAGLVELAAYPNIGVKVSGFNYHSSLRWDFPYPDAQQLFGQLRAAFGAERLYWGSDFPASRDMITYTQSLEVVRSRAGLPDDELDLLMGDNLDRLLNR